MDSLLSNDVIGCDILTYLAILDSGQTLILLYIRYPVFRAALERLYPTLIHNLSISPTVSSVAELCVHLSLRDPSICKIPCKTALMLLARHNYPCHVTDINCLSSGKIKHTKYVTMECCKKVLSVLEQGGNIYKEASTAISIMGSNALNTLLYGDLTHPFDDIGICIAMGFHFGDYHLVDDPPRSYWLDVAEVFITRGILHNVTPTDDLIHACELVVFNGGDARSKLIGTMSSPRILTAYKKRTGSRPLYLGSVVEYLDLGAHMSRELLESLIISEDVQAIRYITSDKRDSLLRLIKTNGSRCVMEYLISERICDISTHQSYGNLFERKPLELRHIGDEVNGPPGVRGPQGIVVRGPQGIVVQGPQGVRGHELTEPITSKMPTFKDELPYSSPYTRPSAQARSNQSVDDGSYCCVQ
jgi:hypothetical protein